MLRNRRPRRTLLSRNLVMSAVAVVGVAGLVVTQAVGPAFAAVAPVSNVREAVHVDIATQQPENIRLEPGGAADVTLGAYLTHTDPNLPPAKLG